MKAKYVEFMAKSGYLSSTCHRNEEASGNTCLFSKSIVTADLSLIFHHFCINTVHMKIFNLKVTIPYQKNEPGSLQTVHTIHH